jgi:hypothetical protein
MITYPYKIEFISKENFSLENSFGILKSEDNIDVNFTISITDSFSGWFELYDINTGGNNWYAEGELLFDDGILIDYDGIFALPISIQNKLQELGFKILI